VLDKAYYVYIVASKTRVLYIGFTGRLRFRIFQHKTHAFQGFSDDYNCERLVFVEMFPDPHAAIAREKQLKNWARAKKIALIEKENPNWLDLAADWWEADFILEGRRKNGDKRVPIKDEDP